MSRLRLICTSILILLVAIAGARPASSQGECRVPDPLDPENADLEFSNLKSGGCFGGTAGCFGFEATPSVCDRVTEWERCWDEDAACDPDACGPALCAARESAGASESDESTIRARAELVRRAAPLFAELRRLAGTLPESDSREKLRRELSRWERLIATSPPSELPTAQLQPRQLTLFPGSSSSSAREQTSDQIDSLEILQAACASGADLCRGAFERQGSIWTIAQLQLRLVRDLQKDQRQATKRYLYELNQRWRSYVLGGRSLFPWELAVNGEFYRRHLSSERGFIEPPSRQFLLLHPELAYEYRDWAESGLNDALVLELLGFYRWQWGEEGKLRRPWGGSMIFSWSDFGDHAIGYGILLHLPRNWSIGAVMRRHDGKEGVAILLAADLPKLFLNTAKFRSKLQDAELGRP